MLGFARALGEFGVTLMIGGDIPGETQTAPLYIYDQIMANQDARAYGMIAVLTATALGALWAVNHLNRRRGGAARV
jgi:molybdate transport system permease protein